MRTTPRTRRWAVLGATAALATAAFALPALAQASDEAPSGGPPQWAAEGEPGERHAELLEELEGLDGDAVIEKLEERFAEREAERAERFAEREAQRAERFAEREAQRAERFAEVRSELEGLEGEELTAKLEELHAEREAFRAERQAEREGLRAERQAFRAERQAEGAGNGFGPHLGADGEGPLASE